MNRHVAPLLSLLLAAALMAPVTASAKLYRWVDEEGRVHYSDRVPPDAIRREHQRLNARGIVVERKQREQTPEERARQEELRRLREEQKRILAEQQARDRVLLRTFRTEDDLILTRDGKVAVVDAQIGLAQGNIKRLKRRLAELQAQAALLEKQGKKAGAKLLEGIRTTRREIEETYASILRHEQTKNTLRSRYDADLRRFRELHSLRLRHQQPARPVEPYRSDLVDTLVACPSSEACDRIWERARQYVLDHSTTRLQVDGSRIVMTAIPADDRDLSLTVSRISTEAGEWVFLDIQCRDNPLGQDFCRSEAVRRIREGFRPAVSPPP